MNLLNINEQRKYYFEEIEKYKSLYQNLTRINDEIDKFRRTGFSNPEERLNLSNKAWKAIREYETQVPEDIQQVLRFDSVGFSNRMQEIFKQIINFQSSP